MLATKSIGQNYATYGKSFTCQYSERPSYEIEKGIRKFFFDLTLKTTFFNNILRLVI